MGVEPLDPLAGRTFARLARHVEVALGALELSLPQYRLLGWVAQGEQASARLAERMDVRPPSVTALVDGLCARGLVERRADPNDRRRLPLHLTDGGAAMLADADRLVHAKLLAVLDELDERSQVRAASGTRCWQEALDRHRARTKGHKAGPADAERAEPAEPAQAAEAGEARA